MKLYRYEDPVVGPRKLPYTGGILDGKVLIPRDAALEVDVEKKAVFLVEKAKKLELGDQITYIVEQN